MTTSLDLTTKSSNKKQNEGFSITDITKKDLRKILKKFNNSPYLSLKNKPIHNEPTEDYFFMIKYITKLMKIKWHIWIFTNFVKLGVKTELYIITKQLDTSPNQ